VRYAAYISFVAIGAAMPHDLVFARFESRVERKSIAQRSLENTHRGKCFFQRFQQALRDGVVAALDRDFLQPAPLLIHAYYCGFDPKFDFSQSCTQPSFFHRSFPRRRAISNGF
jgi:hypothetical protein